MTPTQRLNLVFSPTVVPAGRLAAIAQRALKASLLVLVVWSIDPAEGHADSVRIECGRRGPSYMADAAFEAGGRGPSPVAIDGKTAADIPVWKTIALGTHDSPQVLRAALNTGCHVGDLAGEVLDRPAFAVGKIRTQVDLVILSAAELGFDGEGASRAAIYKRATQLGLALCPAEVAPQLRLQYPDQPPGEFLHVAMLPIATHRADHAAFVVGNGGAGLLLIGSDARPERLVPSNQRFVFTRPR